MLISLVFLGKSRDEAFALKRFKFQFSRLRDERRFVSYLASQRQLSVLAQGDNSFHRVAILHFMFSHQLLSQSHRYCIEFEVIKATKACHKDPTYKHLEMGERVVVKCDLEAFLPNEEKDDNSTNEIHSHSGHNNLENETIEDYNKHLKAASKTKSKYRCRGEGSTGRNTRFSAMAIPSCHGKWMRLTVGQPKKCSYQDAHYIFV